MESQQSNDFVQIEGSPTSQQANKDEQSLSCCDFLLALLYGLFFLAINLCPIIGQINAIHTLCNYEKYLGAPGVFERRKAHFQLMLNGYFVIYFVVYLFYYLIKFVIDNIDNQQSWWKRHTAQTIAGLIVFKIIYELWRCGLFWVYEPNTTACEQVTGHIFLTIGSVGLFVPFRIVQLICNNWDSPDPWKRHIAQTIGGLIIFKLWYEMFNYGIKWVYGQNISACHQFIGYIFLTVCSAGLFIPFRIIQLIVQNWDSPDPWKRHIAQTLGGFIVFKIWYELFHYGIKWVYPNGCECCGPVDRMPDDEAQQKVPQIHVDCGYVFLGYIFLTIASLGLYLPYAIVELIVLHWFDKDPCKRHLAQTVGGLVIFKLWYELYHYGIKWIYPGNNCCFLCNDRPGKYEDANPSTGCEQFVGHIFLTIGSFGLFIPYRIIELIILNWMSPNPCKRHLAQTIGGLVIGKIWYELYNYGTKWVYDTESFTDGSGVTVSKSYSLCEQFTGYIFLTICTFGLFVPFRIIQLVAQNWYNEEPWKRHLAQTIGGLIIFKVWFEMFNYGFRWAYGDYNCCEKFLGNFYLTIATLGLYVPYKIIELVVVHFYSDIPWKRHLAQLIGCLIIFKLWYELFHYGIKWVYHVPKKQQVEQSEGQINSVDGDLVTNSVKEEVVDSDEITCGYVFLGYLFLTIATGGLYLIYAFFEAIIVNWNSPDPCKRHFAQTIGGLIILKLWYEMFTHGKKWVYPNGCCACCDVPKSLPPGVEDQPQNPPVDCGYVFLGYIFLTITSFGIYLPYAIVELIILHWFDENPWKRHIAQTLGGLFILKLWYEMGYYGAKWIYPGGNCCFLCREHSGKYEENNPASGCEQCMGHIFLTVVTFGLFIPYRIIELIVIHWQSPVSWKRHLAQTVGGLIIFKLWYEVINYGIKWVYGENQSACYQFLGHIFLTIGFLGLFVPFRIIQLIVNNWNSPIVWKRHLAQTIGGLIIFKLWYEAAIHSYDLVYGQNKTVCGEIVGRFGLVLVTLGLFILFMMGEYVYWMVINLQHPPYSKQHSRGVIQLSIITGGLYWCYYSTKSRDNTVRYTGRVLTICLNAAIYYVIYEYVAVKYMTGDGKNYIKYVIIGMAIINYITYLIISRLIYNENVRYVCTKLWQFCVYCWWGMCHGCDYVAQFFRWLWIKICNRCSIIATAVQNGADAAYCSLRNRTFPWMAGQPIRVPGSPNYIPRTVYHANIQVLPPVRTWDDKIFDRLGSDRAIQDKKLKNTIYCINCVIGKLVCEFNNASQIKPPLSDLFWAKRFDQIDNNTLAYHDMPMKTLRDILFVDRVQEDSIIPGEGMDMSKYDDTKAHFERYLSRLYTMKKAVYKKDYATLDTFIARGEGVVIV
jgi:hypothetical protein